MKKKNKILIIFNPHAGEKRELVGKGYKISIKDIKSIMKKYFLKADYAITKSEGDATVLARNAVRKRYQIVLAAGGDGTINEVANGLVNSNVILGIIPLGTFVNTARMMAIPRDIEQSIELVKIKRVIKMDLGTLTVIKGKSLAKPYYFIETSGVGLDAEFQRHFDQFEKKHFGEIIPLLRIIFKSHRFQVKLELDNKVIETKANLVVIANGPITGAGLKLAPGAKLNNHYLTVVIYNMSQWSTLRYFFNLIFNQKSDSRRITKFQTKTLNISTKQPIAVHAGATLFGQTPVSYKINAACLNIICGFSQSIKKAGFL